MQSVCQSLTWFFFVKSPSIGFGGDDNRDDDYTSAMTTERMSIKENANTEMCVNRNLIKEKEQGTDILEKDE